MTTVIILLISVLVLITILLFSLPPNPDHEKNPSNPDHEKNPSNPDHKKNPSNPDHEKPSNNNLSKCEVNEEVQVRYINDAECNCGKDICTGDSFCYVVDGEAMPSCNANRKVLPLCKNSPTVPQPVDCFCGNNLYRACSKGNYCYIPEHSSGEALCADIRCCKDAKDCCNMNNTCGGFTTENSCTDRDNCSIALNGICPCDNVPCPSPLEPEDRR